MADRQGEKPFLTDPIEVLREAAIEDLVPDGQWREAILAALAAVVALRDAAHSSIGYWVAQPEELLAYPPQHDNVKRIMDALALFPAAGTDSTEEQS